MAERSAADIVRRYREARRQRGVWEDHWRECYAYALPQRAALADSPAPGAQRTVRLYDGSALDAVEQLAASLLAQLTPPWSSWFGLQPGVDVDEQQAPLLAPLLDNVAATALSHFERSNFAVEMHQCFLDLVTIGSACLSFEEAPAGSASAFHFSAVPMNDVVMEEDASGRLSATMRRRLFNAETFRQAWPEARWPQAAGEDARIAVIEAVWLQPGGGYAYAALLEEKAEQGGEALLARGVFDHAPFINFRWLKAPGEIYGRSPVMKALPDIKTANKVVELILKNATIAVTGIWQAEDDGVINPAAVRLTPGAIIPKAVGSKGLTPLEAPGRFDVSQLLLEDLRRNIRQALLADRLGPPQQTKMTATEVLERSDEMVRILGATYGRLQSELLIPLVNRALSILRRRGAIDDVAIDGSVVALRCHAPLACHQRRRDARNVLMWLESVASLGGEALAAVDLPATTRWLAEALGAPAQLLASQPAAELLPAALEAPLAAEETAPLAAPLASPDASSQP